MTGVQRFFTMMAAVLALTPALALAGSATYAETAGAQAGTPEQELAARFAPRIMLVKQSQACGPGEPYRPTSVDVMFNNPSVALRGPWTQRDLVKVAPTAQDVSAGLPGYALDLPGNPLKPGCAYEQWANSQLGGRHTPAVTYARVAHQSGKPNRLALQYFFFYAFNDYNNKHETDWERIQLEFDTGDPAVALESEPVRAVYSQHYGSEYARWGSDKLEIVDDTHPVVYVSAGSHANQFSDGVFMGNSAVTGFGCDSTTGDHTALDPEVITIPSDQQAARTEFPWLGYRGHWGEVGPRRFYEGPTGPNRKVAWNKPFTWSANARANSIVVPGSEAASSRVTETYCSLVGRGSDGFRQFVDQPAAVLLILGLALLAVGWIIRRTSWETTPLPLVRHRTAGQVIVATGRMIGAHPWLFARLAAPMILVSVAAGLTQLVPALRTLPHVPEAALLIEAALAIWATAATAYAMKQIDDGYGATARTAFASTSRRAALAAIPLALAGLILLLASGTVVLVPIGLLLLAAWSIVVPMVVLERHPILTVLWHAIRRSVPAARTILPVALLAVLLATSVGALVGALIFVVHPAPMVILSALPSLVAAILWPLITVASTYCWSTTA